MRASGRRVAAGVVLLLLALLAWRTTFDFDLGTHLATGRWIAENSRLPRTDPFTYTVSHRAYLAYSWLFDLGLHGVERTLGSAGFAGVRWLLVMATAGLLLDLLRVRGCSALAGTGVGFAAVLAANVHFNVRPALASLFLSAATLWVLERWRSSRFASLWLLPLLQLVWVNVHLYVLGWAILGAFIVGEALRRRRVPRDLLPWVGISGLAVFANPYGRGAPNVSARLSAATASRSTRRTGSPKPTCAATASTTSTSVERSCGVIPAARSSSTGAAT